MKNYNCEHCKDKKYIEYHPLPEHDGATLYSWVKPKKKPCVYCSGDKT